MGGFRRYFRLRNHSPLRGAPGGRNWALQARYHKLVRRSAAQRTPAAVKKAILAVAHTLLKIAYQVLKNGKRY